MIYGIVAIIFALIGVAGLIMCFRAFWPRTFLMGGLMVIVGFGAATAWALTWAAS